MRAPTRREFGIAAHLQQTTRADCIRDQSFIPIARIGTFFALVIETLEHNAISENHEVLRDQTHRERMNGPLQFHERSQHFIGANDEPLSVAVHVSNPDCSALSIHG